ncbi:hypothetical protein [Lactococcus lactis]|uniref:hypothetical protein n=1 Tax=Lactococcus lactis TaxID=1358 RepID=UPI001914CF26|nr:hypothetical protein [Lactococcus lactis]WDA67458.1 hypothetical protein IL310_01445 [Lactococcus lactis]WDA67471.1 hypothetical protein IL310_01510 [Lactococcus lactis]
MQQYQLKTAFREGLSELFSEHFEVFLEEKGIPERYLPNDTLSRIVERQYDSGVDEFLNETKQIVDEDNYRVIVQDFLFENYDPDFMTLKFEESPSIDLEDVIEKLQQEVVLHLVNTEPYGNVSRDFWQSKVRQLQEIKTLARYAEGEDLFEFVETNAPEWQEQDED